MARDRILGRAAGVIQSDGCEQFLRADASISQNILKRAASQLFVKWNCDGKATRLDLIAQADVTALLPDDCISELSQYTNEIFSRNYRELRTHRFTRTLPIKTLFGSGSAS